MENRERAEDQLLELLLAVRAGECSDAEATTRLREYILRAGSASPDNVNCAERVEIGRVGARVRRWPGVRGLKIRGRRVLVSEVLHVVESMALPTDVADAFPALTQAQWAACMRFVTLLFTLLEEDPEAMLTGCWKARGGDSAADGRWPPEQVPR